MGMDAAAEKYVRLVLALGEHDPGYVDAYYGEPRWREEVRSSRSSIERIHDEAVDVHETLQGTSRPSDSLERLRLDFLARQTGSLIARAEILMGRQLSFDEESKALYDAVAPTYGDAYFRSLTRSLEEELPGKGPLWQRLDAFRTEFLIPPERLDAVFEAAIGICRTTTAANIALPEEESFTVEYVTGRSWSGYNWYRGGFASLIQVNTDLPVFIDRAIDLAGHEGYPGHHVYNVLLEKTLVRDRGWAEFTVYPLFSPQSLIAEGSANYGIEVAFPRDERIAVEREVLFPLAGLDGARADHYYRVDDLVARIAYAGNEAARRYLDRIITAAEAADWLSEYALMEPARARQRIRFFDQYRSYVINYNLGRDLVRDHVERRSGGDMAKRWEVFAELLSSPRLPSGLVG
jgi:hypothetical protein